MDDLDVGGENSPSTSTSQPNGHTGITLVLPSLRALKAANAGKKSKSKQGGPDLDQRPKIPRPIKLKPLKEVLAKLINQIKKKDDYAFFIQPVDLAQVPGYTDVIKNPMDFGTMTVKVAKGRYRSLEEFTNDFRLVTMNAKIFNPPGSIYHAEADRLEAWGLEHIARASAHVIEYETDWNIDIEQDDDGSTSQVPVNIDDEVSTPRDLDGSLGAGSRAPSMTPAPGQPPALGSGRRGPRGPYKKHAQTALSEGLDAEGRLPGAKDGVGAFPAGSDWAELMLALKIKGKRYRTKKERLRFEKEGPPYHVDGSLDYAEMEDPFSILNVLVPEPPSRPQVTPLYPPPSTTGLTSTTAPDATQPRPRMSQPRIHVPTPVTTPSNRPIPVLSTLLALPIRPTAMGPTSALHMRTPNKRRHWTIVRNAPARSRAKDKEADTATAEDAKTNWKIPQDAGAMDYGTFTTFLGELAASATGLNPGSVVGTNAADHTYGSEQRLLATIRSTVKHRPAKRKHEDESDEAHTSQNKEKQGTKTFWTDDGAEEAWDYLRDIVYGGVDGYAYVRSLAEFVSPPTYLSDVRKDLKVDESGGCRDVTEDMDTTPSNTSSEALNEPFYLDVPIARYVEDNLIDMVTRGRHGWLRDVFLPSVSLVIEARSLPGAVPTSPFLERVSVLPSAVRRAAAFEAGELLDMASLIRTADELANVGILEGVPVEGGQHAEIERALVWSANVIEELDSQVRKDVYADFRNENGDVTVKEEALEDTRIAEEEEEEEEEAANAMDVGPSPTESRSKAEPDADMEEDPLVKRLRMNLLALTKRAPLDRIATLPVELVPESIRNIVPTA